MSTVPDSSARPSEATAAYKQKVEEAAAALPSAEPTVGVLHDAGLDRLLDAGTVDTTMPCSDLPHFPASDGTVETGTLGETRVLELPQSLHLYDGYTPREVTFPVRMLALAGIDTLLLTGTAGSVRPSFRPGDLMLLTDHINFQGQNPLVGPNVDDWGPRFPDMTVPYAPALRQHADLVAREEGISLRKGIYLALLGPHDETAAEHRMARRLGADVVGTSLVPEVIAARHMDLQVLALVLIGEEHRPDGRSPVPAQDEPPLPTARSRLHRLLTGTVARLGANAPAT